MTALGGGRQGALRPFLSLGLGLGVEVGGRWPCVGPQSRQEALDALPRRQAPGECPPRGQGPGEVGSGSSCTHLPHQDTSAVPDPH